MTTQHGTYDINSLLEAKRTYVKDFGEVKVNEILQADLAAWNTITQEMVSDLCETSTDALRWYGRSTNNDMVQVDEFGIPPTIKAGSGYNIGFPLNRYSIAAGFTRAFLDNATVSDIAQAQLDAEKAHKRKIYTLIRESLFRSTNRGDVRDVMIDKHSVPVYRLLNKDGNPIPDSPYGGTFTSSTHMHYTASGSFTNQVLLDVVENVTEHGFDNGLCIYINRAQEAAVLAFADTRDAQDRRVVVATNSTGNLSDVVRDLSKYDDTPIGTFHGADIWTKPWIPANYVLCFAGGDSRKPLVFRQAPNVQGLRLVAEVRSEPLLAREYDAYMGFGVWERAAAVVHYIGGDSWTDAV